MSSDFVVVVDSTRNKHFLALCCIVHKGNDIAEAAFLYPLITIKLGCLMESFYVLLHVQALFGTYSLNFSIVCNRT